MDDTFGAGRFASQCGEDCGVNKSGATASIASNGQRTETCNLAAERRSKVVRLHVDRCSDTITTHRLGISSAASVEFLLGKPVDFTGPKCIHFQTLKIFQCRGFIYCTFRPQSGTRQTTTPTWLLWMFSFENYAKSIFGPRPEVDWNAAWNEVLRLWNERVTNFIPNAHVNTWSYITCKNSWNLARHVPALPAHPGVQRLLSWHPFWYVAWAVQAYFGIQTSCILQVTQI